MSDDSEIRIGASVVLKGEPWIPMTVIRFINENSVICEYIIAGRKERAEYPVEALELPEKNNDDEDEDGGFLWV